MRIQVPSSAQDICEKNDKATVLVVLLHPRAQKAETGSLESDGWLAISELRVQLREPTLTNEVESDLGFLTCTLGLHPMNTQVHSSVHIIHTPKTSISSKASIRPSL